MNLDLHVAVISAGRPDSVAAMAPHLDGLPPATWYVADGDGDAYRAAGAERVVESGPLCRSRNAALDDADGRPCLQLSDDLRRVELASGPTRADVTPATLAEVAAAMATALADTGARLAGVAPTANPYFSRQRVHSAGFCVGDLILVAARCPLRFDEGLRLKEDYDYTLQHLDRYGQVARLDWVLASFAHRTNKGGAVAVRTRALEQLTIVKLMRRWPQHLRLNPRRPNEVLLRWKPHAIPTPAPAPPAWESS